MDIVKFFIVWGPTLLFVLLICWGILIGIIRGFRKSLILFIHMLSAGLICLITFLIIVNQPGLDAGLTKTINQIVEGISGQNIQSLLEVKAECNTFHEILLDLLIKQAKDNDLATLLIEENAAYLNALVEMAYRLVVAVFCGFLYTILLFIFYIIYFFAYPVRRKIRKEEKLYQIGEVNHPYKRRRLLGGLVGGTRALIMGILCFSFLGTLIFVVTGGSNLASKDEIRDNEETDSTFNSYYDYYSSICAMGDTGIFKALNSLQDTNHIPFYFYFADLVFQGSFKDETLGVEDKLFLRDEVGTYVEFVKKTYALLLKYADENTYHALLNFDVSLEDEEFKNGIISAMSNAEFSKEFARVIDEFEAKPFMANLCLSSLTAVVNHIDLVTENELIIGLVHQLFKSEDAIRVTDLATSADVKTLFKGLLQVISSEEMNSTGNLDFKDTKMQILVTKQILPTIQSLSLFHERSEVGNKIISGLYKFASTNLVEEELELPTIPVDMNWIEEFNILLATCDPMLSIAYEIYDSDKDVMTENLLFMFERENANTVEEAYDRMTQNIVKSKLLDVVFKSSIVGKQIDQLLLNLTGQENISIPKNMDYVGDNGECKILLNNIKLLLKNGGGTIYKNLNSQEETQSSKLILEAFDLLTKDIKISETETSTLIEELLKSKICYYTLSTYLSYAELGSFKLYIPESSCDKIVEGSQEEEKVYYILKRNEIDFITDLILNCSDEIAELIDQPSQIDYVKLLTNDYINTSVQKSLLLQGTLANVLIHISLEQEGIVIPKAYITPEAWISNETEQAGEIKILMQVVHDVAEVKDENNEPLLNTILNGAIHANTLLNLEDSILKKLCESIVIRYTISDKMTSLDSEGFEIVVAKASIEIVNALTATNKTVNVIYPNELFGIFRDIKKIIYFDEQNNVKVNYAEIFKNKAEICESKTLTATLIQMMLKYEEFLKVPYIYQLDFEKIKETENLEGNVWFGENEATTDDELYLMLEAIETLIEKDESGNIPQDFDFETIQEDLTLRSDSVDTICSSVVLSASMSQQIVSIFNVPQSVYVDESIVKTELQQFFKAVFLLFNKSELKVIELDDNLFQLEFKKETLPLILESMILQATISQKIYSMPELFVSSELAADISYVDYQTGYMIDNLELNAIFSAMFDLLDAETIYINKISSQFTNLEIPSKAVEGLVNSKILQATISNHLVQANNLTIPKADVEYKFFISGSEGFVILKNELKALFDATFVLLGTDKIIVSQLDEQFSNLILEQEHIETILSSNILHTTLSKNFMSVESITIPSNVIESVEILNGHQNNIEKLEFKAFFDGLFITSKSSIHGTNFTINDLVLPTILAEAEIMTNSLIISATLSENIKQEESIILLVDELEVSYIFNSTLSVEKYIEQEELAKLLIALTVGLGKTDPVNLGFSTVTVPATEDAKIALTDSLILRTTISEKILSQSDVSIDKNSLNLDVTKHINHRTVGILSAEEILNIITGLEMLGSDSGFDNLTLDVAEILRMENSDAVLKAIAASDIYRYIISTTLGTDEAYRLFHTEHAVETIVVDGTIVSYQYQYDAITSSLTGTPWYVINYPQTTTEMVTSFDLNIAQSYLCSKADIIALGKTL